MYGAMKRMAAFLTAACMLTLTPLCAGAAAERTIPDRYCWSIADTVFTVGADEYVRIPVYVYNSPAIYGCEFDVQIDGKTPEKAGFEIVDVKLGDAYDFGWFEFDAKTGHVGSVSPTLQETIPNDGLTVVYLELKPTADAQTLIGQSFEVSFFNVQTAGFKETKNNPTVLPGTLTFAAMPEDAEPERTIPDEYCWSVADTVYTVGADEWARLPVFVHHSPRAEEMYHLTVQVNGKPLEEAGYELVKAEQGYQYPFGYFEYDTQTGQIGSYNNGKFEIKRNDGLTLVYLYLKPTADPQTLIGQKAEVTLKGYAQSFIEEKDIPAVLPGTITYAAMQGDADWSGSVDILDVICVNKFLLGTRELDDAHQIAADADGDGRVTESDPLAILKKVLNKAG